MWLYFILINILWSILVRPRTIQGLAVFQSSVVCHSFFFFFFNFFQGGLINFEKRRRVSRDFGCDFPFYFIYLGMTKWKKQGLKFLVEAEKNESAFIEHFSYTTELSMFLCLIRQEPCEVDFIILNSNVRKPGLREMR